MHIMTENCHSTPVCTCKSIQMPFFGLGIPLIITTCSCTTPPALSEHLHSQRKLVTIHTLLQPAPCIVSASLVKVFS